MTLLYVDKLPATGALACIVLLIEAKCDSAAVPDFFADDAARFLRMAFHGAS